ncbi:uncharacterized protein LOC116844266 [Odontomachus brunneus]|uniref:uncharacterized protein LOC116844266 n=1 Tax=Odontomachus brunneus TaxID=486640 RepID=UPI0013F2A9A4|nr:uncharacterized protein LOC116844266 [Odontomachus brunneus]XP_032671450.1 uncharacterized protein LOC116844266 [Odontomachus brunneus]XP_032671452.1 uncharacterized protein LOC116844266 [Odontomachus brunneus]
MAISCKMDYDCPNGQYCYDSSSCVNFTRCIAFNRQEAAVPARDGSQCGPCLKGFYAAILEEGVEQFCQKNPIPHTEIDAEYNWDIITIWYIVFALILILSLIYIYLFYTKKQYPAHISEVFKKKYSEINEQKVAFRQENSNHFIPNAPSEVPYDVRNESIERNEVCCQPFYNNGTAIVNNKSQNAVPFQPPNWVENADLSGETNNNAQYFAQRNISRINRLSEARNDPENNEQLAILIPEPTVEHEDNARNTALMQINDNADDTNSTNSANDERNDNGNRKDGTKVKTVVINQNITMNVNVSN